MAQRRVASKISRKKASGRKAGPRKPGKKTAQQTGRKKKAAGRLDASPAAEKGVWSNARAEQHRLKREAILRVASRLINHQGYAGMSLADVASQLEIRNASLYYYFESKEKLVFACYERAQRIVAEALDSVERRRGSGLESIERYVVSMREHMRERGELPIADRVWALRPAHMKAIIASDLEHRRRVAALVERGIEDGSIRPCNVALTTTMLFSALQSVGGHYLGVARAEWPELDAEVLAAIRHFLAA